MKMVKTKFIHLKGDVLDRILDDRDSGEEEGVTDEGRHGKRAMHKASSIFPFQL
jgi:hypothetical protein